MGQPNPADSGATPPANPPTEPAKTEPPTTDGLGEAGKKALEAERTARKDLESKLKQQEAQLAALAPLGKLAEALGVKPEPGKTDVQTLTEQVTALQRQAESERLGRLRAEVAAEKKLPAALAGRLQGSTVEELAADADLLLAAFPATPAPSGVPVPDPSQGPRGGANDLYAAIAAAEQKGDVMEAIRLKGRLLPNHQ